MTLPQLYTIRMRKKATGVSAISWAAYTIYASFWLAYGIMHKKKPIIVTKILWILLDITIVVGSLIY